jgi:hypothetical protein
LAYEGTGGRGEQQAVRNVMKKIQNASSMEELLEIVKSNAERFKSPEGKTLPVIKEFLQAARSTEAGKKKLVIRKEVKKEKKPKKETKKKGNSFSVTADGKEVGKKMSFIDALEKQKEMESRGYGQREVEVKKEDPKADGMMYSTPENDKIIKQPFQSIGFADRKQWLDYDGSEKQMGMIPSPKELDRKWRETSALVEAHKKKYPLIEIKAGIDTLWNEKTEGWDKGIKVSMSYPDSPKKPKEQESKGLNSKQVQYKDEVVKLMQKDLGYSKERAEALMAKEDINYLMEEQELTPREYVDDLLYYREYEKEVEAKKEKSPIEKNGWEGKEQQLRNEMMDILKNAYTESEARKIIESKSDYWIETNKNFGKGAKEMVAYDLDKGNKALPGTKPEFYKKDGWKEIGEIENRLQEKVSKGETVSTVQGSLKSDRSRELIKIVSIPPDGNTRQMKHLDAYILDHVTKTIQKVPKEFYGYYDLNIEEKQNQEKTKSAKYKLGEKPNKAQIDSYRSELESIYAKKYGKSIKEAKDELYVISDGAISAHIEHMKDGPETVLKDLFTERKMEEKYWKTGGERPKQKLVIKKENPKKRKNLKEYDKYVFGGTGSLGEEMDNDSTLREDITTRLAEWSAGVDRGNDKESGKTKKDINQYKNWLKKFTNDEVAKQYQDYLQRKADNSKK